jgi:hypothetical protein
MNDIDRPIQQKHPGLQTLPECPTATIAVLATVDDGPYSIPVSAPLRVEDRRISGNPRSRRRPRTECRDDSNERRTQGDQRATASRLRLRTSSPLRPRRQSDLGGSGSSGPKSASGFCATAWRESR